MRGAADIASFIREHYSGRLVEVGIGRRSDVADLLAGLDLVATDRENRRIGYIEVVGDDIFNPNLEIYQGASLIYSIRPTMEMQLALGRLACMVGADLLIRPLGDEIADLARMKRQLVNRGWGRFYLFRPER
ncbi:MAG TPA: UPF0146 family protein [Methanotrichaceae archaeon]|nr:UPF0146 family protein [Methanotrichaceae archaeon]HQF17016.1 UPF0146 family protein [Methanotrichaceae archaeon]HQI91636.1 UPF0146 family protein [Methanotrichaceae archaeon]HQJ28870.1 UPF0146 family protein [Methanotrichaceae archaeon]